MGEKAKKKSFGRRMLIFFVGIFAVIGLLCMLLCVINPVISPNAFVITSFFGLAFWPIFVFNVMLLLAFIVLKSRKTLLLSVLALVIAIPGFIRSYAMNKEPIEKGCVKIMSYNIANFRDVTGNKKSRSDVKAAIIDIINSENPDIVCLQEGGGLREKNIKDFARQINCDYYVQGKNNNFIFSKYPLENDEFTEKCDDDAAIGVVRLVKTGDRGCFYVECVHLQSFRISKDEIEYLNDAKHYVEYSETKGKSLIYKLKRGFEQRTDDTRKLVGNMPGNNAPIIVCGDFNDTPQSYTYRRMRKAGLNDAFQKVGKGIGKTYCGKLPFLRIDYFWCSANIVPMTFERYKQKMSDHYPIIMTFNVTH